MTSAPYIASRKRRIVEKVSDTVLSRELPRSAGATRDHDTVSVYLVHFDGNAIHRRQRLLVHDLVDRSDPERALHRERDPIDVVRDLIQRMAHHEHRQVVALVQLT